MSDIYRKYVDYCTGAGGVKCYCCRYKKSKDRKLVSRIAKRKFANDWKKEHNKED